jgi:hypothetical protein
LRKWNERPGHLVIVRGSRGLVKAQWVGQKVLPEGRLPCRSCRGFPRTSETPRTAGLKRPHPLGSSGDLDGAVSWIVSPVQHSSSSGNFVSSSASDIPNATAVALLVAPNSIIARTKRRSASRKFEASLLSSAASAFLSAARRSVIAFRFRPDPGLAPPRPSPRDFVISNSLRDQNLVVTMLVPPSLPTSIGICGASASSGELLTPLFHGTTNHRDVRSQSRTHAKNLLKHANGVAKRGYSAFFVRAHHAAVSGDIRRQNCRKPPFFAIVDHYSTRNR